MLTLAPSQTQGADAAGPSKDFFNSIGEKLPFENIDPCGGFIAHCGPAFSANRQDLGLPYRLEFEFVSDDDLTTTYLSRPR